MRRFATLLLATLVGLSRAVDVVWTHADLVLASDDSLKDQVSSLKRYVTMIAFKIGDEGLYDFIETH